MNMRRPMHAHNTSKTVTFAPGVEFADVADEDVDVEFAVLVKTWAWNAGEDVFVEFSRGDMATSGGDMGMGIWSAMTKKVYTLLWYWHPCS